MSNIKVEVGDYVLVSDRYGKSVSKVTEITKAGNIRILNGILFSKDGMMRGSSAFNMTTIKRITEDEYTEFCRSKRAENIKKYIIKNLPLVEISLEDALAIKKIIDKGSENE